jgi:hypothetical protein
MRRFILKISVFSISLVALLLLLLQLPPTPYTSKSLLFAAIKKDSLLANAPSPRIIFVGGSNLSFGLNSQMIKDSLNLNPINTAIHAGLGLKYMLENTSQYIKEGDIIVVAPEVALFYWKYDDYCSEELLRTVWDVNRSNIRLLSLKQMINCVPFIAKIGFSKLNPKEYINKEESDVYSVNSFNEYGDVYAHWNLDNRYFVPDDTTHIKSYDPRAMEGIKEFEKEINRKSATLYVSYPSYQETSFLKSVKAIEKIKEEYIKYGFTILGTPDRYMMNDSLMFDTAYHLNKKGLDYRTELLIEDLKNCK